MAQEQYTAPAKSGTATKKYWKRKHVESVWKDLGDYWRGRRTEKGAKKYGPIPQRMLEPHRGPPGFPPNSNDRNANDGHNRLAPQQFQNAPNQAPPAPVRGLQGQGNAQPPPPPPPPQQQQQPRFHQMPNMNNAHGSQSGEMDPHMQRGGQTEFDERPRGQNQSVYVDAERPAPGGGGGGGATGDRQPQHPWMPETQYYEQAQTRRRRF